MSTSIFSRMLTAVFVVVLGVSTSLSVRAQEPSLYLIAPINGAEVTSPVTVKFGLSGMGVAPAGVQVDNTGHHHLLIDVDTLPDLTMPLAKTDNIRHFGGGQTEASIELTPGKHTLQLVLGNYAHIPQAKPLVSEKITIIVK